MARLLLEPTKGPTIINVAKSNAISKMKTTIYPVAGSISAEPKVPDIAAFDSRSRAAPLKAMLKPAQVA